MRARKTILLGALLLVASARVVLAHDQPYSYLDLRIEKVALSGRVAAHVVDLAHEAAIAEPESLLDEGFLARHREAIRRVFAERLAVEIDGRPLAPRWGASEVVRDRKLVACEWTEPLEHVPARVRVRGPLFTYDAQHETYLNVYQQGRLRLEDLLDRKHPVSVYEGGGRQGTLAVVGTFLAAGIHHIFIGPDHILFIIGLLLLGGGLARLLKIITAFTVAHSITLALATFRIVNPPSFLIEPAIALSIVYVGIDNLWSEHRGQDPRAFLAFAFGFVHGFGFASVLRDFGLPREALGWSLFSFNAGVEVGQACIVLAVAPLLAWIRAKDARLARRIVLAGSLVVAAAGGYWFLQRIGVA